MLAFKAFSNDMKSTHGNFQNRNFVFEKGKKYIEEECKCSKNGYHCAENPLCCLTYYNENSRFFIVDAGGDINQDGLGSRISCTELTIIKEISIIEMGVYACEYIVKYPKRKLESDYAVYDFGVCNKSFLIVRGKNPEAKGIVGSVIFFLKEDEEQNIVKIGTMEIGQDGFKPDCDYVFDGGKIFEKE